VEFIHLRLSQYIKTRFEMHRVTTFLKVLGRFPSRRTRQNFALHAKRLSRSDLLIVLDGIGTP